MFAAYSGAGNAMNRYDPGPYPGWETHAWIILIAAEVLALFCIYRLWRKKSSDHWLMKALKSVVLLFPILGVLFFLFVNSDPKDHGELPGDLGTN
jgi:hypothetical protein